MCRYSKAIETSVKDLVDLVKSGLKPDELVRMSAVDSRNNEPDAYSALLNMFTQRNIDSLVKCTVVLVYLYQNVNYFMLLVYLVI